MSDDPTETPTVDDVARWMLAQLEASEKGELNQEDAAVGIQKAFGDSFVEMNEGTGYLTILDSVLDAFTALTPDNVVYHFRHRYWSWRQPGDKPGRMQP